MNRSIPFFITVCLCFSLFVNGHPQTRRKQTGQQQKTSNPQNPDQTNKLPNTQNAKARSTSPDTVAQAMVKSLKDYHAMGELSGMSVTLEGDEKTAFGNADSEALKIALATTGESLTGQQKLQAVMQFRGWFMSRRPLTPKKVADYLMRFRTIDKATVEKWEVAQRKSDESSRSPCLILAGIVFHDFLFEGGQWKNGNPDRAIARLASLTKDSVSKWKAAVGSKDEAYGAWSLIAVDSLFVNDTFQPPVFDAAFPIAQKLLSAR